MNIQTQPGKRNGSALLDIIAASIVTALVLVPSLNIMRRSMNVNNRIVIRQEMATACSSLLEQQMADAALTFRALKIEGRTSVNTETLGYRVIRSDHSDYGGIPKQLMGISVTVWHDANKNRRIDTQESRYELYSKVARTDS